LRSFFAWHAAKIKIVRTIVKQINNCGLTESFSHRIKLA
jgi:hypothetical protein